MKRNGNNGCRTAVRASGTALLLAACLSAGMPLAAHAMPPYDHIPEGCSEETWNRMQDNLIEWDEIGDLVQYYNPAYTKAFDSASGNVTIMQTAYPVFVKDMHAALDTADEMLQEFKKLQEQIAKMSDGTKLPPITGITDKPLSKNEAEKVLSETIRNTRKSMSDIRSGIRSSSRSITNTSKSIERSLMPVKKQLTQAMQGVVFSYEQTLANRETVAQQVALYQTTLETQQRLRAQGLATDYDVLSAQQELQTAQNTLSKLDNGLDSIRRAIGLQLGWDGITLPEIGAVPEPEVSYVDTTNPDADKTAAIMHNREIIEAGKAQHAGSFGMEIRDRTENEKKGLLVAKMDSLYADMKEKKALYEASLTTLERARLSENAAKKRYELGMLGRAEYEGQQLACISYEASAKLAKLNLLQSVNTYQWAVDGYVSIDD
ncbi:MAG: TolC family protein [Eubacteriales bacterium]|nr:TolC family protein [Eubacteriales bacterium]